jgi:pyridoxal phosphate enzyme (YggS family)
MSTSSEHQKDGATEKVAPTPEQIATFKDRLAKVSSRITQATKSAGRTSPPLLLAVSKAKPASEVAAAICAGLRHFGENYLQEALEKQCAITAWQQARPQAQSVKSAAGKIYWHYIGNVQSNKTRVLAENFDWIHTVSSEKQIKRLNTQRPSGLAPLNICLQVNVDQEPQKQGIALDEVPEIARACLNYPRLVLRGLMCIPAQGTQTESFKALANCLDKLKNHPLILASGGPPSLDTLSMGMSADLEAAIAAGSTIVRIGSALFGKRAQTNQPLSSY